MQKKALSHVIDKHNQHDQATHHIDASNTVSLNTRRHFSHYIKEEIFAINTTSFRI